MGVGSYIKDIKDTVTSVFEGMSITFSHLVRRPMTIQYPDKIPVPIQETLPHRYRGILEVDLDICTGCLACERDCPISCITIGIEMDKESKQRKFTHFDIDSSLSGVRRGELQSRGIGPPLRAATGRALQTKKGWGNRSETGRKSRHRFEVPG